jgi:hypothetical protein
MTNSAANIDAILAKRPCPLVIYATDSLHGDLRKRGSATNSFAVLASADDFATSNSESEFCDNMMSVVFDPDTGEKIVTRDSASTMTC